ncbi:MAG: hypothetical protein KIH09_04800, partial [Candidatus Freyarchaeota archaeon]|nr:hypothetical protein [Candidatus Jordarchaeia archaeon]
EGKPPHIEQSKGVMVRYRLPTHNYLRHAKSKITLKKQKIFGRVHKIHKKIKLPHPNSKKIAS